MGITVNRPDPFVAFTWALYPRTILKVGSANLCPAIWAPASWLVLQRQERTTRLISADRTSPQQASCALRLEDVDVVHNHNLGLS